MENAADMQNDDAGERRRASQGLAREIATTLDESRCEQIVILDVHDLSQVTDCLVIATGTSDRQMRTAARKAEERADELGETVFREHSDAATTWVVLDLVDVVVHIFEPHARAHYDLEMLWGDAPRLDWTPTRAGTSPDRSGNPPAASQPPPSAGPGP